MRFSGSTFLLRLSPAQAGLFFRLFAQQRTHPLCWFASKTWRTPFGRSEAEGMDRPPGASVVILALGGNICSTDRRIGERIIRIERTIRSGGPEMHKLARLLTLVFVLLQSGGTALAQTCEYAGQTFSPGATICECPNLRVVRGAGGRGEITSRRLACSKDQTWVNTNSLCLIA